MTALRSKEHCRRVKVRQRRLCRLSSQELLGGRRWSILESAVTFVCQSGGPEAARRFLRRAGPDPRGVRAYLPAEALAWRLGPAARASSLVNSWAWPLW